MNLRLLAPAPTASIDWLNCNCYAVVTKATKKFIDASGRRKVKGSMDIELAVDAMELTEQIDQMVLFAARRGYSEAQIVSWEQERAPIYPTELIKLCHALDVMPE